MSKKTDSGIIAEIATARAALDALADARDYARVAIGVLADAHADALAALDTIDTLDTRATRAALDARRRLMRSHR